LKLKLRRHRCSHSWFSLTVFRNLNRKSFFHETSQKSSRWNSNLTKTVTHSQPSVTWKQISILSFLWLHFQNVEFLKILFWCRIEVSMSRTTSLKPLSYIVSAWIRSNMKKLESTEIQIWRPRKFLENCFITNVTSFHSHAN
jgi:hypothetical protein